MKTNLQILQRPAGIYIKSIAAQFNVEKTVANVHEIYISNTEHMLLLSKLHKNICYTL